MGDLKSAKEMNPGSIALPGPTEALVVPRIRRGRPEPEYRAEGREMNRILALLCAFALGVAVHPYTEKEIVKLCSPSVVYIQTEGGSGTGFFINSQGYVLTCHHVVKDMKDIQVKYQGQAHKAELVSSYPDLDQAIVAIRLEGTPYVRVKENQDPNSVSLSDQVVVMGFPLGIEQLNVNGGKISAVYPDQKVDTIYQSDAVINPGNSGGPVFDMDGNAISRGHFQDREGGRTGTSAAWVCSIRSRRPCSRNGSSSNR